MGKRKIKIPIDDGKRALEFLRSADLKKVPFLRIKEQTDILVRCGFSVGIAQPLEHWIFRGVVVDLEKLPEFSNLSRINYRPRKQGDTFFLNRASSNKYQVFYGAVPTPDFDDAKVAAVLEIDSIRKDTFPENEYEYIAIGMWFTSKQFTAANVGMHSDVIGGSQWAKNIVVKDSEFCDQLEHGPFIKEIMQFMGKEFGKEIPEGEDYLYKISAAYGDSLFDQGVPAIMFPSWQTRGKTFNLAMRSEAVDDKCIDIETAAIVRGLKVSKEIFWGLYLQCPRIYGDSIRWDEPPRVSQITGNEIDLFRKIIAEKGRFAEKAVRIV